VALDFVPREVLALIAAVAVTLASIQALSRWSRDVLRRRRMALRMKRAQAGERRAASWLEERGFAIVGAQVAVDHPVRVDGRVITLALRADYLVEKGGRRYGVEVKTGAEAPRIETSATRRQMLEYRIAFDVDGVMLVDGETGRIHEVSFPALEGVGQGRGRILRAWPLVAFAVAAAAVAIARYR
jgi:hypothetical protein